MTKKPVAQIWKRADNGQFPKTSFIKNHPEIVYKQTVIRKTATPRKGK